MKSFLPILALLLFSCSEVTEEELEEIRINQIYEEMSFKGKGREYIRNHLLNVLKIEEQCKRALKYFPKPNYTKDYKFRETKRLRWEWFGDQLHELNYRHGSLYIDSEEYPAEEVTYECKTIGASENWVSFKLELSYYSACSNWGASIDSKFNYYLDDDEFIFWGDDYWDDYERNFFSNVCRQR